MAEPVVVRVQPGVYRVEHDGRSDLVYVAGNDSGWWAFWNGTVFGGATTSERTTSAHARSAGPESLFAPMPATVIKVLVQPGDALTKGSVAVVLEAMKMELP